MKKYIGIFSGIILALSLGFVSAQVNGGLSTCISWNHDANGNNTTCAQYIGVSTGGVQTNGAQTVGTPGTPAYQQGVNGARQTNTADLSFVSSLLAQIGGIVKMLPPILMGVAVVAFFWFLIRYFITDAAEDKSKAVKNMGYSLAAIFVMVTLWGIIAFFGDAIGLNPNVQVSAPQLPH